MERKLIVTIFAMAALALLTQIAVWIYVGRDQTQDFVGPPRSDYTLTNFTVDSLDEYGQHSFTIVAPWMVRKEEDGSMYVTTPESARFSIAQRQCLERAHLDSGLGEQGRHDH